LLQAFFEEFSAQDKVALHILTAEYHASEGEKPRELIQRASDAAAKCVMNQECALSKRQLLLTRYYFAGEVDGSITTWQRYM
jgi:hypothetical protein